MCTCCGLFRLDKGGSSRQGRAAGGLVEWEWEDEGIRFKTLETRLAFPPVLHARPGARAPAHLLAQLRRGARHPGEAHAQRKRNRHRRHRVERVLRIGEMQPKT